MHQKTRCKDGKGNICCSERSIDDQRKECQQRSGTVQSSSQPAEEFSARGIGVTDKPSTMIGLDSERECSVCEFSKVKSRKRSNIDSKVDQLVSTSNIFFPMCTKPASLTGAEETGLANNKYDANSAKVSVLMCSYENNSALLPMNATEKGDRNVKILQNSEPSSVSEVLVKCKTSVFTNVKTRKSELCIL